MGIRPPFSQASHLGGCFFKGTPQNVFLCFGFASEERGTNSNKRTSHPKIAKWLLSLLVSLYKLTANVKLQKPAPAPPPPPKKKKERRRRSKNEHNNRGKTIAKHKYSQQTGTERNAFFGEVLLGSGAPARRAANCAQVLPPGDGGGESRPRRFAAPDVSPRSLHDP